MKKIINDVEVISDTIGITYRPKISKDIIYFKELGIEGLKTDCDYKLNFSRIKQFWLKSLAIKFLTLMAQTRSAGTLSCYLTAINMFSDFLKNGNFKISNEINREIITQYLLFINKKNLSKESRRKRILNLSLLFDIALRERWISLPTYPLFYKEDVPKTEKPKPRFIPQTVMSQLNQNIEFLHPHIMRMILILQECGMRISELLTLQFNPLLQDNSGDFFLKTYMEKMKKEHTIPITKAIVGAIREQQCAVIDEWGKPKDLLFPMPKKLLHHGFKNGRTNHRAGKHWKRRTIINSLNRLSKKNTIVGADGKQWFFHTHQFRHTVGTRMINNGTPQHIVQRFLGHESPLMTSRYTYIMDQTLKDEFAKFHGRMVDIHGKMYDPESLVTDFAKGIDANDLDTQWLKRNIAAQALPNGLCSLPVVQGKCPHANACLECHHFRTDHRFLKQHKLHLEKTNMIIQIAQNNGWKRQLEINYRLKDNLLSIIKPLEGV